MSTSDGERDRRLKANEVMVSEPNQSWSGAQKRYIKLQENGVPLGLVRARGRVGIVGQGHCKLARGRAWSAWEVSLPCVVQSDHSGEIQSLD